MARAMSSTSRRAPRCSSVTARAFPHFVAGFPPAAPVPYLADMARSNGLGTRPITPPTPHPLPLTDALARG